MKRILSVCMLVLGWVIFTGCSGATSTGSVTINLQSIAKNVIAGPDSTPNYAIDTSVITRIEVTATGADMKPITGLIDINTMTGELSDVPAGSDRVFTIVIWGQWVNGQGVPISGRFWGGITTTDIKAGANNQVDIVVGNLPRMSTVNSLSRNTDTGAMGFNFSGNICNYIFDGRSQDDGIFFEEKMSDGTHILRDTLTTTDISNPYEFASNVENTYRAYRIYAVNIFGRSEYIELDYSGN